MADAKPIPPSSGDVRGIDYADVSAPASHQPVSEGGPLPLPRDGIYSSPPQHVTDGPPA